MGVSISLLLAARPADDDRGLGRKLELGGEHRVLRAPAPRSPGRCSRLPLVHVELAGPPRRPRAGSDRRRRASGEVLVAEEGVEVLPLALLHAGRLGGDRGQGRVVWARARNGGTRTAPSSVRAYSSTSGSIVSISKSAQGAHWRSLKTVIVTAASVGPRYAPPAAMPPKIRWTSLTPPIGGRLRAAVPDRDRDDRRDQRDQPEAEEHAGHPGASTPGAQPATAL